MSSPETIQFLGGFVFDKDIRYADGIDILYSANVLHLTGFTSGSRWDQELMRNLPRLILPQRLASIRSLELLWMPRRYRRPRSFNIFDERGLERLCEALPEMFPRLENLDLPLHYCIEGPRALELSDDELEDPVMAAERVLLGPVEALVLQSPNKRLANGGVSVYVSADFWRVLLRKHDILRTPGLRAETDCDVRFGRFWKRLPGRHDDDWDQGYWVCSGSFDNWYTNAYSGLDHRLWGIWEPWHLDGYDLHGPLLCPHVIYRGKLLEWDDAGVS